MHKHLKRAINMAFIIGFCGFMDWNILAAILCSLGIIFWDMD